MSDAGAVEVHDAPDESRFEATVGGRLAGFAEYVREGDVVVMTHTEVDDAFEGQGVGSALARGALDEIRAAGQRVVPQCPFIRRFIGRHSEYEDLVVPKT